MVEHLCVNYELCEHTTPANLLEIFERFCMTCGSWFTFGFGWDALEFRDTTSECSICFKLTGREMKFPTNCGHWFCVECCRLLLFFDEERFHIDPVPYGCSPCVHTPSCKSRPCCEEDDEIIAEWERTKALEFDKWVADENKAEDSMVAAYGSKKCPLCRVEYDRNIHGKLKEKTTTSSIYHYNGETVSQK